MWRVPVTLYVTGTPDDDLRWEVETLLDAAFPAASGGAWTVDWAGVAMTPVPSEARRESC